MWTAGQSCSPVRVSSLLLKKGFVLRFHLVFLDFLCNRKSGFPLRLLSFSCKVWWESSEGACAFCTLTLEVES